MEKKDPDFRYLSSGNNMFLVIIRSCSHEQVWIAKERVLCKRYWFGLCCALMKETPGKRK